MNSGVLIAGAVALVAVAALLAWRTHLKHAARRRVGRADRNQRRFKDGGE